MSITQVKFFPNELQYAGFIATAEPSLTVETFIASSGETSGALYDLVDNKRTALLTIETNSDPTEFSIDLDLVASIANADFLIFDNHNLGTATAKVKVTHGGTVLTPSSAKAGSLGSALTVLTITSNYSLTAGASTDGIILINLPATSDNNWEALIAVLSATFAANITLGELAIGKSFTPSLNPTMGEGPGGYNLDGIQLLETKGGKRYANIQNDGRKYGQLVFQNMPTADRDEMERIYYRSKKRPLYLCLDANSATPTLYYVRLMNNWNATPRAFQRFDFTVDWEEEI